MSKIDIADSDKNAVLLALTNKAINDFEDGLEYYAALDVRCDRIYTEDVSDFHFSEISEMNSRDFLMQYLNE